MKGTVLASVAFAAALCSAASADCVEMPMVPLGTQSAKDGKGQVCGYTYLVTQRNGGKNVSELGIAKSWYKRRFSGKHFEPVALPVGFKANCPQHAPKDLITLWSGVSDIYVRREFQIAAESLASIQDMIIKYIIDDKILQVFVNGKRAPIGDRPVTKGCGYWAGTNQFTVPASYLKAGKNSLAIRGVNTGGPCYLDLAVSFSACQDGASMSELHSCSAVEGPGISSRPCRARCEEENYCRNKEPEECGTSFQADVTGSCMCAAAESLSCSGESADVAPGVCYESTWMTSQVSRLAFCAPKTDLTCNA